MYIYTVPNHNVLLDDGSLIYNGMNYLMVDRFKFKCVLTFLHPSIKKGFICEDNLLRIVSFCFVFVYTNSTIVNYMHTDSVCHSFI